MQNTPTKSIPPTTASTPIVVNSIGMTTNSATSTPTKSTTTTPTKTTPGMLNGHSSSSSSTSGGGGHPIITNNGHHNHHTMTTIQQNGSTHVQTSPTVVTTQRVYANIQPAKYTTSLCLI